MTTILVVELILILYATRVILPNVSIWTTRLGVLLVFTFQALSNKHGIGYNHRKKVKGTLCGKQL